MLFRTHILFSVLSWLVLERFVEMPLFVLPFVLLGAAFVDIDSCGSKIGKSFWFFSWAFRHRGILHSLFACFLLSSLVGIFNLWAGFGFFLGYLSHIVIDSFTKRGIAFFWPANIRFRGPVRSGSWVEDVIFVSILFLDIWLGFNYLF